MTSLQVDTVGALVLAGHVADDVVVQEGQRALRRGGLGRQYVEGIQFVVISE